ncbi:MAG: metal ABC transporter ATP-binding protein [Candidatus Aenigmarchaeota archaeon]|nr:metal ABC transporter ATP-binding protein [Candidatus Aenigmarchaeota archaeon]
MKDTILEVKNLTVKLDGEKIIEKLSFSVNPGDILTVIGPNGAGKTTLLRALLGLINYEGKIKWKKGIKVNYLPQGISKEKFSRMPISIKEFFRFKEKSDEKILSMFKEVGLDVGKEFLEKNPGNLSSGQFQRLLIAWSLIDDPDVLLLDEPTSGIDVGGEKTIYSLLKKMWSKTKITIILVTHDLNVVYAYSNRCLCLSKVSSCYGPPRKILTPKSLQKIYNMEIKFYKHDHR